MFSCDDKQLTLISKDDITVQLWDSVTEALSNTLKDHLSQMTAVTFLCNDKQLASASHDITI